MNYSRAHRIDDGFGRASDCSHAVTPNLAVHVNMHGELRVSDLTPSPSCENRFHSHSGRAVCIPTAQAKCSNPLTQVRCKSVVSVKCLFHRDQIEVIECEIVGLSMIQTSKSSQAIT
jgi:hypothetical protein